ncbi:DNA-directed RNA polymerase subunit K [Candidatus Pacearchaeota archaeon CG10_big_fil_rev_8_21_14_0_10_34_76]|nr:MAG: DNA-directed RNA polymerase subunit K [Candidatus Pacearchaeota archaeon CG10_big_fil_rev_8_21_14_0_10_34_76]
MIKQEYTRYEVARIIGARALQISMDAPLLINLSEKELEEINYDPIKIADKEFEAGALPITVHRPIPKKREVKLPIVKEDKIDDAKIIAKEKEVESEITEKAEEMGFAQEDDIEDFGGDGSEEED